MARRVISTGQIGLLERAKGTRDSTRLSGSRRGFGSDPPICSTASGELRSALMRRLALIAAASALLAGCGGEESSDGDAPKPQAEPAFDTATVKVTHVINQQLGGLAQVYFIAKGPPPTHVRQARACVAHYTRDQKAAFCYTFPSEAAFKAARVGRDGMDKLCWSAMASKALSGFQDAQSGNEVAEVDGCPAAYVG